MAKSFAAELRGESGTPRPWAYVQLGEKWFVREPGYKLNEAGDLFDMSDAPFTEKLIAPKADTEESKSARQRLATALYRFESSRWQDRPGRTKRQSRNLPRQKSFHRTFCLDSTQWSLETGRYLTRAMRLLRSRARRCKSPLKLTPRRHRRRHRFSRR